MSSNMASWNIPQLFHGGFFQQATTDGRSVERHCFTMISAVKMAMFGFEISLKTMLVGITAVLSGDII